MKYQIELIVDSEDDDYIDPEIILDDFLDDLHSDWIITFSKCRKLED